MNIVEKRLAYTQTFSPTVLNNTQSPLWQYDSVIRELHHILRSCCDFELYPELTINNVLHFHGILTLRNEAKFRRSVVKRLTQRFGHITLKKFDAYRTIDGWKAYCNKDVEMMKTVLEGRPIPLTQLDAVTQDDNFENPFGLHFI